MGNEANRLTSGGRVALLAVATSLIGLTAYLLMPVEQFRVHDPSGRYTAIVSSRRALSYLPSMPGQGSDKAGFITIVDSSGSNLGRIPVELIWMARELDWKPAGAELKLVGAWDFDTRTCWYWNDDQSERIQCRASPFP